MNRRGFRLFCTAKQTLQQSSSFDSISVLLQVTVPSIIACFLFSISIFMSYL